MAMEFRNKAIKHERRLISYVAENFRLRYDLEGFTHLTQVMQADAIATAYTCWRQEWSSTGQRQCGGVLAWQLNDCWSTISWSVVEYHRVPKPAYYTIKRAMESITIAVQRRYKSWTGRTTDGSRQRNTGYVDMRQLWEDQQYTVWIANRQVPATERHRAVANAL
jgi:beta-mannosidase